MEKTKDIEVKIIKQKADVLLKNGERVTLNETIKKEEKHNLNIRTSQDPMFTDRQSTKLKPCPAKWEPARPIIGLTTYTPVKV